MFIINLYLNMFLPINPIWTVYTNISQMWKTHFRTKPRQTQPTTPDGHQPRPPSCETLLVEQKPS
jgi:hypothetical protein